MTRAMQSRAIASERDEPSAIIRAGDYRGREQRLDREADIAAFSRDGTTDDPRRPAAFRELAGPRRVERVEDHIHRVVDAAPPLTAEQRDKLTLLLRGSGV
ncbi:hypothetical protein SAMN05660748_1316 [Blastococcus aggregatus]|uniref:Uncharacterized protein n=1 Tax=Blastococcus aggregatus TaxID=38502 RepID=A0A285V7Y1_9ACTN|nr:hypothetical protein [Blastococcus aggregatus]SOC48611.1 hypothetical protein SAMN05660748_1316 [Blastococcus aggregatus]